MVAINLASRVNQTQFGSLLQVDQLTIDEMFLANIGWKSHHHGAYLPVAMDLFGRLRER